MEPNKEKIQKWMAVYAPERYGINYPPMQEIKKMLEVPTQREEALDDLWRMFCFSKHFKDYEESKIPERNETKQSDVLYAPAHMNDLGLTNSNLIKNKK